MTFHRFLQVFAFIVAVSLSSQARAVEITVMSSGGFYSAMQALAPVYEKQSGDTIVLLSGSSMGSSPTSIPARLKNGEKADLIILAGTALDKLIDQGFALPGSRVDLVHSKIGMAVKAGDPKPDISTKEAFENTLMQAPSIGYSASASGVHLVKEVFPKLGAERQKIIMDKAREVVTDRVATVVARGELAIGFQQVSEMLAIPGVELVGTIPAEYQKTTTFSIGVAKGSPEPEAAQNLVRFLTSQDAWPIIEEQGLEPAGRQ